MKVYRYLGLSLILIFLSLWAVSGQTFAQDDSVRPDIVDEETYGTTHFLIHYTLTGEDAVASTDDNGDGVPDYIELLGSILESAWQVEIEELGWSHPPEDRGEGGDNRVDIYITNLLSFGIAGYVDSSGGRVGDNPFTTEIEHRSAYSYMGLDNDYSEAEEVDDSPNAALNLMQTTIVHELNHVIQAGYDEGDPHTWLYESTSMWIEDQIYDDVNDGVYYIYDLYETPDVCILSSATWYGNWLFLQMLSERYGDDIPRTIWEHSRDVDGFDSIKRTLEPFDTTFREEVLDYGIANLLSAYEEGDTYPTVRLAGTMEIGSFFPQNGVQSLGYDYIELKGSGRISLSFDDPENLLNLRVVGVRDHEADIIGGDGQAIVVDLSAYDYTYAVIHNIEQVSLFEDCIYEDYELVMAAVSGNPSSVDEVWDAKNFLPATEESHFVDGEPEGFEEAPFSSGGTDFTPESLNIPFEPIILETLPPGYEFDFAYILTEADFEDVIEFYLPGGGVGANYDYYNAEDYWLGVIESESPYANIQEWMDDIGYDDSSGDIQEIGGISVLIEDLSDDDGDWFSATLVIDDLFIVVDSDESMTVVIRTVEALITESGAGKIDEETVVEEPEQTGDPTATPALPDAIEVTPETFPQPDEYTQLMGVGLAIVIVGLCLCFLGIGLLGGLLFLIWRMLKK